ncbi:hypothetical protein [Candidatus Electronema sp. JM]|uniref:hypothetical protein n=1 Tax=Candidatus Electronema sp. JM TaxID=3401571 RepID=UPI003AA8C1BD
MSMNILRVEQPCPQCGGSVVLAADDRLLTCPYCKVKSFLLASGGPFRYALPNRAKEQTLLLHAPYLRFKGNIFSVTDAGVSHKVLDTTQDGSGLPGLPASLGVRPQAMPLLRVHSGSKGRFLPFSGRIRDIFEKATKLRKLMEDRPDETMYHQAYIGETLSFIYLPLLPKNDILFDAVQGQPLPGSSAIGLKSEPFQHTWQPHFRAALCPRCGGNLEGEGDCLAPICSNCDIVWQIGKEALERTVCKVIPGGSRTPALHLPFWRIAAELPALGISSFADFAERTNQPFIVRPEWRSQQMRFWVPAFKLRPEIFLRTAKQITISQRLFGPERDMHLKTTANPYPVTLPLSEARQSLKVILAASAASGRNIFSRLPEAEAEMQTAALVYLPFDDRQLDWTQSHTGAVIGKSVLQFGRKL